MHWRMRQCWGRAGMQASVGSTAATPDSCARCAFAPARPDMPPFFRVPMSGAVLPDFLKLCSLPGLLLPLLHVALLLQCFLIILLNFSNGLLLACGNTGRKIIHGGNDQVFHQCKAREDGSRGNCRVQQQGSQHALKHVAAGFFPVACHVRPHASKSTHDSGRSISLWICGRCPPERASAGCAALRPVDRHPSSFFSIFSFREILRPLRRRFPVWEWVVPCSDCAALRACPLRPCLSANRQNSRA